MAAKAVVEAMEQAKITPQELDAIIYAGVDRDHFEPAMAHIVQDTIRAKKTIPLDVSNACTGFINAMHLMDSLTANGQVGRGLVVTGENGHRYTQKAIRILSQAENHERFSTLWAALTLGDAGAAAAIGPKLGPDTGFILWCSPKVDFTNSVLYLRKPRTRQPLGNQRGRNR